MTEDPTVELETGEEIDWLRQGRHRIHGMEPDEAVREICIAATKPLLQKGHVEGADQQEIDDTYSEFKDTVNMTASEIRDWGDHRCSDKASVKPEEVRQRVIDLLETPKEDWGDEEVDNANRVISFVNRMRGVEQGEPAAEGCPSDRDISLMNWGYKPDSVDL